MRFLCLFLLLFTLGDLVHAEVEGEFLAWSCDILNVDDHGQCSEASEPQSGSKEPQHHCHCHQGHMHTVTMQGKYAPEGPKIRVTLVELPLNNLEKPKSFQKDIHRPPIS